LPVARTSHRPDPDRHAEPWLRKLGVPAEEARAYSERMDAAMPGATVAEQVIAALRERGARSRPAVP
jgi:hypothetical protein